jgi:solute carrier family 25 protein 14/30
METKAVWKGLVFGGISASAAEIATFPIDSVKTRMQLQGELGKQRVYSNSLEAAVRITRTEGVSSLYKVRMGSDPW